MGVFANVPKSKYDSLNAEDKKAVDEYRNQEYDVDVQAREGGDYGDVVSREENKAAEKPTAGKSSK